MTTTTRDTRPTIGTPRRPRADYVPFDVADPARGRRREAFGQGAPPPGF